MNVRSIQIYVLKFLGLEEEFKDSYYGSYGWFLRSHGITIYNDRVCISPDSRFKPEEHRINDYINQHFALCSSEEKLTYPCGSFKFGNRIAEKRRTLCLSQSELASIIEVSKNTISSYERSEYLPTAYHCMMLCIALHCSFEDLFYLD